MSSERTVALSVRGLSKAYTIAHEQEKQSTLAETLLQRVRQPFRRAATETFWALRDISFDIPMGEVVGIIGRNGAGKSTLLKILSRITEPTTGQIDLFGRVGSLLEVGTGFHPELTGRENIFLNGAILGMTKAEIRRQFDAIVDFSGVAKFLDTPVKRYSSGMYVRLAFAVAAHLESEILIVDEVLAVGDAEFQKRCLGKMKDVATGGRTVLFVSHNMAAIQNLCTSGVFLQNGRLKLAGKTDDVIQLYLGEGREMTAGHIDLTDHSGRSKALRSWMRSLTLSDQEGNPTSRFASSKPISVALEVVPLRRVINPRLAFAIEDQHGRRIGTTASYFDHADLGTLDQPFTAVMTLPSIALGPGRYLLSVSISEAGEGLLDSVDAAAWFDVEWDNTYQTGEPYHAVYGPVILRGSWKIFSNQQESYDGG